MSDQIEFRRASAGVYYNTELKLRISHQTWKPVDSRWCCIYTGFWGTECRNYFPTLKAAKAFLNEQLNPNR